MSGHLYEELRLCEIQPPCPSGQLRLCGLPAAPVPSRAGSPVQPWTGR